MQLVKKPVLKGLCCSCSSCKFVEQSTSHWTCIQKEPLRNKHVRKGDRVLVQGLFTGVVKYVGDLDSKYANDQTFIGVKLDDPGRVKFLCNALK